MDRFFKKSGNLVKLQDANFNMAKLERKGGNGRLIKLESKDRLLYERSRSLRFFSLKCAQWY